MRSILKNAARLTGILALSSVAGLFAASLVLALTGVALACGPVAIAAGCWAAGELGITEY